MPDKPEYGDDRESAALRRWEQLAKTEPVPDRLRELAVRLSKALAASQGNGRSH